MRSQIHIPTLGSTIKSHLLDRAIINTVNRRWQGSGTLQNSHMSRSIPVYATKQRMHQPVASDFMNDLKSVSRIAQRTNPDYAPLSQVT